MDPDPAAFLLSDERYRVFLHFVARSLPLRGMQAKLDSSDLIQETLLRACAAWPAVQVDSEAALLLWLRSILVNAFRDAMRRYYADARDVRLEINLARALHESSRRVEQWLADQSDSPASGLAREEEVLRLAEALTRLPEDQQAAVEMKYLHGRSVAEIGARLGRTRASVAGLIRRGTRRLRELMEPPP